jgi:hypothetical protein
MGLSIAGNSVIDDSLIASIDATYVKTMTVAELLPNATGQVAGFTAGGSTPSFTNTVDRFPFSTPFTTATDIGDLTGPKGYNTSSQSSEINGYTAGGINPSFNDINVIESFPFSAPFVTATDVGDMSIFGRNTAAGQSSTTDGYVSGGYSPPVTSIINTFPFSTPFVTATSGRYLTQARGSMTGVSSLTHGYTVAGYSPPSPFYRNTIDRFPFTTPFTTATDVGDASGVKNQLSGQSSTTDGYVSGGYTPPSTYVGIVDKFPFSTPFVTATTGGTLSTARRGLTGQSSTTNGYGSGGWQFTGLVNTVDRFPFSTPFTSATDIGDLTSVKVYTSGQQD